MARWSRVAPQGCRAYQALDARVALIQALIPVGLQAVEDVLQQEVSGPGWSPICAPRWSTGGGAVGPAAGIGLPDGPEAAHLGAPRPENATTCATFLRSLLDRGLRRDAGLLVVLDGARGWLGRSGRSSGR
jgi:hypothetical protein